MKKIIEPLQKFQRENAYPLGLQLPVISKDSLIAYKKILSRPEDIIDINEIFKNENRIIR